MTFLFDIGRVLLDFDFETSLARLLPATSAEPRERLALLLEKKDEFEAGLIEADSYIAWALGVLESPATANEFRAAWRSIFTPNEPMWRHVAELAAAGHRLILFSNINTIHWPWVPEAFPRFSVFHGAVLSFESGFIKPDPRIYDYAIAKYGLDPADTLYIDDLPKNVASGREAGFRSWQYDLNDHAAFERWLAVELSVSSGT